MAAARLPADWYSNAVEYSTLSLTYLLLVGIAAQAIGIYAFWFIQKKYHLSVKTMFNAIAIGIILLDGWGLVGIFQQRFGMGNRNARATDADVTLRISPCVGVLALPSLVRPFRVPLVFVQSDHDLRR